MSETCSCRACSNSSTRRRLPRCAGGGGNHRCSGAKQAPCPRPLSHPSPHAHAWFAPQQVARGQDSYSKGVIRHRGISTPSVDAVLKAFLAGTDMEPAELRALGLALLREPLQVRLHQAAEPRLSEGSRPRLLPQYPAPLPVLHASVLHALVLLSMHALHCNSMHARAPALGLDPDTSPDNATRLPSLPRRRTSCAASASGSTAC